MSEAPFPEIEIRDSEQLPLMSRVEGVYLDRFGDAWDYQADAWKRLSRVFERLDSGGDILDVGAGSGQFANCLAWSEQFASVTTIDATRFGKYIELDDSIQYHEMSVGEMAFEDDAFDVVTCMEVLEHVPEEIFEPAIAELRRVCRGQLVITVPYREPEPISETHVRRFEDEDFLRLFPNAEFAILRRPRKPWMMIQERFDGQPNQIPLEVGREGRLRQAERERDAAQLRERDSAARLRERIAALEREVNALRGRKVVRAANAAGRGLRRIRSTARRR
ncbi:class I SAM-dependent methyltransferase [Egibacter rhizosphaerae]|uniref:Class I SAM-dependent methyltransferase n=1 Tax=Egibacter rhizosphaerae TaxID=1670831 RepID=A0A411YI72_9ACTN|nr:class I SAM-dependent methyltransferase [Egibacter rhizosphaerae]QBI20887.1 class I SAM-dependent methyltransferase [Egibacter rhizosphaerae]